MATPKRKQAEDALAEERNLLRTLIDNLPDLIYAKDTESQFILGNIAVAHLMGATTPDELIGKTDFDFYPQELAAQYYADEQEVIRSGQPMINREEPLVDLVTGRKGWLSTTKVPLRDSNGKITGLVGIGRNITERKRAEEELRKSNQELKEVTAQLVQSEKLSALGELTAGVAHELNQPLNSIKIICQSILRDIQRNRLEEEDVEQDLTEAVNQVNKMAEIIDHMRVFTRRSEGLLKEMIDINIAIEGPFKLSGQQLKNYNIEVIKELSPDLLVIGDPIRLEQVFMNLITNARNAVESSGKENKRIEIRTYKNDNRQAVVEVKDNGVGIPEDLRERIFQPFFTTQAPGQGTGLGLSVARKIIEEHEGRIELESQVGEGTTFKVILPIAGLNPKS